MPRHYPEREYNISYAKRRELVSHGERPVNTASYKFIPRQVPQPSWTSNREALKRMRRFYLETGITLPGVPRYMMQTTYLPVEKYQAREDWDQIEVIRDIRQPRL